MGLVDGWQGEKYSVQKFCWLLDSIAGDISIGGDETTRFNQPNSSSLTVNRVHDNDPSKILGTLSANGNIVLINPNGVFFGKGSKVDVGGIIATAADGLKLSAVLQAILLSMPIR